MNHRHEGWMSFQDIIRERNDHDYSGWRGIQRKSSESFDERSEESCRDVSRMKQKKIAQDDRPP